LSEKEFTANSKSLYDILWDPFFTPQNSDKLFVSRWNQAETWMLKCWISVTQKIKRISHVQGLYPLENHVSSLLISSSPGKANEIRRCTFLFSSDLQCIDWLGIVPKMTINWDLEDPNSNFCHSFIEVQCSQDFPEEIIIKPQIYRRIQTKTEFWNWSLLLIYFW